MCHSCVVCLALVSWSALPAPVDTESAAAAAALVDLLSSETPDVRREAVFALAGLGRGAVPELARALRSENVLVRMGAAITLGRIGRDAAPAVFTMTDVLPAAEQQVRLAIVEALGRIGYPARAAVLPLVRLGDPNHSVQDAVRDALRRIGGSIPQVGQLAAELRNENPYVREAAAYALGLAGAESQRIVPALIPVIHDEYPNVQLAAIDALGSIGPVARPAVLELVQLPDEDPSVHSSVRAALNRIGADPVLVPELSALLQHSSDAVRESAAYMLGMLGPEARSAILPLAEAAHSGSDAVRGQAAMALRKIVP